MDLYDPNPDERLTSFIMLSVFSSPRSPLGEAEDCIANGTITTAMGLRMVSHFCRSTNPDYTHSTRGEPSRGVPRMRSTQASAESGD